MITTLARDGRTVAVELLGDGRGGLFVCVAFGWFLSLGTRLIFPAMVPHIRADFGLTLTAAGLLYSVLWASYAAGQLPGGMLGDRIGAGVTLVASTVLSGLTILVVTTSLSVWTLFAGTILFGLASAPYGPIRLVVLSNAYPDRDGAAIGLVYAVGNLGNTFLPLIALFVASALTWRMGFGFVVPLFALAALGLWLFVPRRTRSTEPTESALSLSFLSRLVGVMFRPSIFIVAAVAVCGSIVFQGFTGLYPTYLVDVKHLSPTQATALFSLFFGAGVFVQIAVGFATDRFGPKTTLIGMYLVTSTGLLVLPFVAGLYALALLSVTLSCLLGFMPVVGTHLAAVLPQSLKGSGLGLLRTVFIMSGATGPVTMGFLADAGYFDTAYTLMGVLALVGLALSTRL